MSVRTANELINLSMNIKRLRQERGWTIRELARRMNTSHPSVIRWEQPIPSMTLDSLQDLADVFDLTIMELFEEGEKHD